jgi:hypothetical protein
VSGNISPSFLTSSLDGGEWLALQPRRFAPGDRALNTLWIRGWVNSEASVNVMEERKSLAPAGNEIPVVLSLLATPTGISRLHFICNNKKRQKSA